MEKKMFLYVASKQMKEKDGVEAGCREGVRGTRKSRRKRKGERGRGE